MNEHGERYHRNPNDSFAQRFNEPFQDAVQKMLSSNIPTTTATNLFSPLLNPATNDSNVHPYVPVNPEPVATVNVFTIPCQASDSAYIPLPTRFPIYGFKVLYMAWSNVTPPTFPATGNILQLCSEELVTGTGLANSFVDQIETPSIAMFPLQDSLPTALVSDQPRTLFPYPKILTKVDFSLLVDGAPFKPLPQNDMKVVIQFYKQR